MLYNCWMVMSGDYNIKKIKSPKTLNFELPMVKIKCAGCVPISFDPPRTQYPNGVKNT